VHILFATLHIVIVIVMIIWCHALDRAMAYAYKLVFFHPGVGLSIDVTVWSIS